jgi:2,3-bisphosphoglycerate-dependent phosphoglycerate mutase
MRLYLIRHGQSSNNALYGKSPEDFETLRSHDPQLTETGQQQAAAIAQFLGQPQADEPFEFSHIYVSPMIRAMDTAKPIAETLGLKPEIWVDIHEVGGLFMANGDGSKGFPGLSRKYIQDCYPDYKIAEEIREDGWWNANQGKESPGQFLARAVRVALAVREFAATKERIILVSHAAFLDCLVKALLNQIPLHSDVMFYNHYNTGMSRFDIGVDSFFGDVNAMRLHYLNRVDHLVPELRTW